MEGKESPLTISKCLAFFSPAPWHARISWSVTTAAKPSGISTWSQTSYAWFSWYDMFKGSHDLSSACSNLKCVCVCIFVFVGAGPPFAPNQFGMGRGNYDNFRGHVGGFPKQRNSRQRRNHLMVMTVIFSDHVLISGVCVCVCRGMRGDPRSIIEYRDLDAPDDLDFF